ncbi:Uncharacterised protein [Mycobacteroides abscessus subsp. abscessus]|nr:Uncharacterised protein [Mycobacteroides abscessus subsp. abscessus]
MVATFPGSPKTSRVMRLGLKGSISSETAPVAEVPLCAPKAPCSRTTPNPATATTTTVTSIIQPRLTRRLTEIPFTRWPFDDR